MGNIIGTGFNAGSTDGELASLEKDLRALAEIGVDTVELGLTSLDLIAGGRISKSGWTVSLLLRSKSIFATRPRPRLVKLHGSGDLPLPA